MILLFVIGFVLCQNITEPDLAPTPYFASPPPTVNPNGFNPVFGDIFIVQNELMKAYNVTYWDLINKPVQGKIFIQSLIEDGQLWYELCVRKGDDWIERFTDYTKFTKNFNPLAPKIWATDMIAIIEKFEELYRRGIRDFQQLSYPWVQYKCVKNHRKQEMVSCSTYELEKNMITPYISGPAKGVVNWTGDFLYRGYEMLFGRYGWVRTGEAWIAEWKNGFKYHRVSQVSRDILFMAEDLKIFLAVNLKHWEGILCGPKINPTSGIIQHSGECLFQIKSMPDGPNLGFIVEYFDYILVVLDKLDEAVEWFALVIGNIIDATNPKKISAKSRDEL